MALTPKRIAILGAGITGLCAAYRLSKEGHTVRIFEKENAIGGSIKTELVDGWLIEKGPNSLQESEELRQLILDLDLQSERIEASQTAKNRYLVKDSKLIAVPMGPGSFLKTPLFSWKAKFSILKELFYKKQTRLKDVSLADFVRSHFGSEILDQAVQPMISGIYAGNPEVLSVRNAFPKLLEFEVNTGSLIRGLIQASKQKKKTGTKGAPKLISFKSGLHTLPKKLASHLAEGSLELGATVLGINNTPNWSVSYLKDDVEKTEYFDSVISALPAQPLSVLKIGSSHETALHVLSTIEHPAVTSLFLGFKRSAISHPLDGFGALIPSKEKKSSLGILFSSSLFDHRAPKDCIALTVMIGGTLNSGFALQNKELVLQKVMQDLKELLGASEDPIFSRHTVWPKAIAQYNLGYEAIHKAIKGTEEAFPGLYIGGQLKDGISVPDCIQAGLNLALKAVPKQA